MSKYETIFNNDLGHEIACRFSYPHKEDAPFPIVLQFHGYDADFNAPYIEASRKALNHAGIATCSVTFRGSGEHAALPLENLTYENALADGRLVVQAVKRKSKTNSAMIGVSGTSFGGIIAMMLAAENGDDIVGVFGKSIVPKPKEAFFHAHIIKKLHNAFEYLRSGGAAQNNILRFYKGRHRFHISDEFVEQLNRTDLITQVAPRIHVPVRMVSGLNDELAPRRNLEALRQATPQAMLSYLEGGHELTEPHHLDYITQAETTFFKGVFKAARKRQKHSAVEMI